MRASLGFAGAGLHRRRGRSSCHPDPRCSADVRPAGAALMWKTAPARQSTGFRGRLTSIRARPHGKSNLLPNANGTNAEGFVRAWGEETNLEIPPLEPVKQRKLLLNAVVFTWALMSLSKTKL